MILMTTHKTMPTREQLKSVLLKVLVMWMFVFACACDDDDAAAIDNTQVFQSLTTGTWRVTYFFDEKDETSDFDGYVFTFNSNGTATATKNSTPVFGSWSTEKSGSGTVKLILSFGFVIPLDELDEDWKILESSNVRMKLEHVSNSGTGDTETLILEQN